MLAGVHEDIFINFLLGILDVSNVIYCIKTEISMNFTGNGLAGMRQKDLIQWYVDQQNERNNYSSMEEVTAEISRIKAIIEVYFC